MKEFFHFPCSIFRKLADFLLFFLPSQILPFSLAAGISLISDPGLLLAESDHVTWILASDWSRVIYDLRTRRITTLANSQPPCLPFLVSASPRLGVLGSLSADTLETVDCESGVSGVGMRASSPPTPPPASALTRPSL